MSFPLNTGGIVADNHNSMANAMYQTGLNFQTGNGGYPKDDWRAFENYHKAAGYDHPDALYRLSLYYLNGCTGVNRDEKKAFEFLVRAAKAGHVEGCVQLAERYIRGNGVPLDKALALEYYGKAAEKGHPHAVNVMKLAKEAEARRAAEAQAQANANAVATATALVGSLAVSPAPATVVFEAKTPTNVFAASTDINTLLQAANSGNADAMYQVAEAYARGNGVAHDFIQALTWYHRANAYGNAQAAIMMSRVTSTISQPVNVVRAAPVVVTVAAPAPAPVQVIQAAPSVSQYETNTFKPVAPTQAGAPNNSNFLF